ncbi:MAG TPA: hypothetical protein VF021_08265 [Longimicrobiales bacterium]
MARYDRIAPLTAPTRDSAFPAWPVLRDIEGNDRDGDFARRARLRFLALRPVRRVLDHKDTPVGRESYLNQIEGVREELGYLPTRDVERARLARFLHHIEDRDSNRVVAAALEMADACAAAGHMYGAEEYALTALGLAEHHREARLQCAAYTCLARIERQRAEWQQSADYATKALHLAEDSNAISDMVRAQGEQALAAAMRGEADHARTMIGNLLAKARSLKDAEAEACGQAIACGCENLLNNPDAALEHGWAALRHIDDARDRAALLEQVAAAFAALGLHKAAERCLAMVAQRGVDPALRARARALQAVQAAALDSQQLFRERRAALLNDAAEWSADPRVFAFVHLELGRAAIAVGDADYAREHLRDAINTARKNGLHDIITSAENVLTALEQNATHLIKAGLRPAADGARRIAEQMEALPDLVVAVL